MSFSHLLELNDLYNLSSARVELSTKQLQTAAQLAQSRQNPDERWQVYRSTLGLSGFTQWLTEHTNLQSPEFQLETLPYHRSDVIYLNCQATQAQFKLCLISVDAPVENFINLANEIFHDLSMIAHFYVLIEVVEDEAMVAVRGFLTYTKYQQYQVQLSLEPDQTDQVPLDWFDLNPDHLLLHLRCLDASAIVLPEPIVETDPIVAAASRRSNVAINFGQWFQNQVDQLAAELGWMFMPVMATDGLRSLSEGVVNNGRLELLRNTLISQRVEVPDTALGACRQITWVQQNMLVYALAWPLGEAEWTLVIALECASSNADRSITLSIRDAEQVLTTASLNGALDQILYAQVIGAFTEYFWVSLITDEGELFEFEPFQFDVGISD